MKTITLGKTGIKVRQLGFGAMHIPRVSLEESDKILLRALEKGINYFDTASAYQDSEEKLGRILSKSKRSDFTILSRSHSWRMGLDDFKKDFEQSFKRLKIETIDFYGFHAVNQPPELDKVMKEPLDFLKEEKGKGRIRHITITGHNPVTMTEAVKTGEFSMAMFPFNVIEQEPLETLLDTANQMGVATSVMKPLGGGMIENKPFALRFFLSHPIGVITPGMASLQEVDANCMVFEEGKLLSPEELKQLGEEVAVLGKEFCRRCSYCMPCKNNIMIPFVHMIHMKCYGKEMNDDVAYTLQLAKRMQPLLEACDECGECVEKCPYHLPTAKRVKELRELLGEQASEVSSQKSED
jgi:predicted aldo/keto reductase-like oxidoreductase